MLRQWLSLWEHWLGFVCGVCVFAGVEVEEVDVPSSDSSVGKNHHDFLLYYLNPVVFKV
ncbi:hypothetical protein [Chryseobacterium sp. PMSZPI]|uniref:hypothetical protein n=1 Tax=Chryseobacterium sp. PMSZPI TaxID=1033900 RepID=UPI00161CCB09|nr:hypothetical protein [Chryseobacterium sp. PMSZPI]